MGNLEVSVTGAKSHESIQYTTLSEVKSRLMCC